MTDQANTSVRAPRSAAARLQASLDLLQRAVSPRTRNCDWIAEVRSIMADLERLNRRTEADFLAVGGNLMEFLTACRELHSGIDELMTLVSGEHVQNACNALVSVRTLVQHMRHRSESGRLALQDLQASASRIHQGFSAFGKISSSFRIAAILARVETAHLSMSQDDLGNLADQVLACSEGIQARATQVLDASAVFDARIASTLLEVSRFDTLQENELSLLLEAVDKDIQSSELQQGEALDASAKLRADLTSVTQDLGAIGTAIQCHDITRQQIEHVIEALAEIVKNAPKRAPSASITSLVKVQKAQLESAAAAFGKATEKIDQDLEAIATRVEGMAAASKCILGLDLKEDETVLSGMHGRLSAILNTIAESCALEQETVRVVSELSELSERLRASVQEVEVIELQLSRLSINAAISADHIGALGNPLGVVASAMQELQLECATRSRQAAADLESIGKVLSSLTGQNANGSDHGSGAAILDDLRTRMGSLKSASAGSAQASKIVAAQATALLTKLGEARGHSAMGSLFAETVDRSRHVLDQVAARVQPVWSFGPAVVAQSSASRYTMQAERDIHEAVTHAEAVTNTAALLPTGEAAALAACDEVEFF